MVDMVSSSGLDHRGWSSAPGSRPDYRRPTPRRRSDAELAAIVEGEIIPRLMLAHRPPAAALGLPEPIGAEVLERFAYMTLASGTQALTGFVEQLVRVGHPLETLYVDLLAPTARRLGDDWNEDLISFTDVTIGLSRLQQLVRAFGAGLPERGGDPLAPSACFVSAPGEQHTFGLCLLDDAFRRAGWRTRLDTAASREDAADAVASQWFDVFGMSATSDVEVETLADTIADVRRATRNPQLFVMVGGRLFLEQPGLAAQVGADAAPAAAADALSVAGKAVKAWAAA